MRELYRVHDGKIWTQKKIKEEDLGHRTLAKQNSTKTLTFDIGNDYENSYEETNTPREYYYVKLSYDEIDRMYKFIHEKNSE